MKYVLYVLKIIAVTALPAFFFYIGSTDNFSDYLIQHNLVNAGGKSALQMKLYIIGIGITALFAIIYGDRKIQNKLIKHHELFKLSLNIILELYKGDLDITETLNVRVFKVKSNRIRNRNCTRIVNFNIKNITEPIFGKNKLTFLHYPGCKPENIQGVVGLCYEFKKFAIDYNTLNTHRYTITNEQQAIIGKVDLCCATPIFKNGKIRYIISIDATNLNDENCSFSKVEFNKVEDVLKNMMRRVSIIFDEFVL